MTEYNPQLSAKHIQQHLTIQPKIAIILGSGLGAMAQQLTESVQIPYPRIPGFPSSQVSGHAGQLTAGLLGSTPLLCCQGRMHSYQGGSAHNIVKNMIRSLSLIGIKHLIITNAAGSLDQDMPPGALMMIDDHINLQMDNPLVGDNDDDFGPRFPPVDTAYHPESNKRLQESANQLQIPLYCGTYLSVMGPSYETKAEIRAFKILGANAVGMSTVPEVLVANHCGLRITAISVITNFATGLATEAHDHANVVKTANRAADNLQQLLNHFIPQL